VAVGTGFLGLTCEVDVDGDGGALGSSRTWRRRRALRGVIGHGKRRRRRTARCDATGKKGKQRPGGGAAGGGAAARRSCSFFGNGLRDE
jgi:hypothetical protein